MLSVNAILVAEEQGIEMKMIDSRIKLYSVVTNALAIMIENSKMCCTSWIITLVLNLVFVRKVYVIL